MWNRHFFGPVPSVRPYLMRWGVLVLLALDAWVVMLDHGGRYGIGAFNVAHFTWLDRWTPVPSPAIYCGLLFFAGLLALAQAVARKNLLAGLLLAGVYTYAWASSLIDSFQHHYLLSWYLLFLAFFPDARGSTLEARSPAKGTSVPSSGSAPAYALFLNSTAIVYFYTGVSKTEGAWRDGTALMAVARERMTGVLGWVEGFGVESETFLPFLGHSVVLLQWWIAFGYVLAPWQDRLGRPLRVFGWITCLLTLSFHLGAEYLNLKIGWFSYYMVWIALTAWLPVRWLLVLATPLRWMATKVDQWLETAADRDRVALVLQAVAAAGLLLGVGHLVDLPGAFPASVAAALFLAAVGVGCVLRRDFATIARLGGGFALASIVLWGVMAHSDVRFDYYRYVGGDAFRRGELDKALDAYEKANAYAPEGKDRKEQEARVRQMLGR
ncbi:MAG: hypothetical protein KC416_11010 [Myxococcales bacterium]|nr:hypothetical protein [Myxococcales bacterium]